MKKRNRFSRSGETLVEIMVSAVVFLILVGILQGAIAFCTHAQQRSEQVRETNAAICQSLRQSSYTPGATTSSITFNAVSYDGNTTGTETLFTVAVNLGTKNALYTDETGTQETIAFYVFGPDSAAGGGGTP